MAQLFKELIQCNIDYYAAKKEIQSLENNEIKVLINDIFWRYDAQNLCLKSHVEKNLINEQKIVNLVSNNPYYLEVLLEEISGYKPKKVYCSRDLSLVKYLKISNKEEFLKILDKITCMNFFAENYNNFTYNEEEKKEIQRLFDNYIIDGYIKLKINIEERKHIYNKTGLIIPFLLCTDLYRGDTKEQLNFFIEYFKYCPEHEIIKRIFLGYNNYEIKNFQQEYYQEFLLNNIEYTKLLTEQFQIDLENYEKVNANFKILNGIKFIKKLTEKILLKYQLENF